MVLARVQHIINSKTGLPRDGIVNTFHFMSPNPLDDAAAQLCALQVSSFYNGTTFPTGESIMSHMAGGSMATNRETFKVYDMSVAAPRVPKYTWTPVPTVANNANAPLPPELALCLSFQGDLVSGSPAARRRGRVYLGPLSQTTLANDAGISRPTSNVLNAMRLAGQRLKTLATTNGWSWVIYSPRAHELAGGDDTEIGDFPVSVVAVTQVSTDDAWDVQRRRGNAPTARTRTTLT